MKGLSLTLTIVIIAIVLLVTALVIMTIFGGQMAQFIGILNPWSAQVLNQNLCYQQCAAWCQGNPGRPGTGWDNIGQVSTQEGKKACKTDLGMDTVATAGCRCTGIPTAGLPSGGGSSCDGTIANGQPCTLASECVSCSCNAPPGGGQKICEG